VNDSELSQLDIFYGELTVNRAYIYARMPRPADELPQNVPEHMRLMLDLIVLAFQMDKTRIATCMLNNDL
jgi:hypothetical protein